MMSHLRVLLLSLCCVASAQETDFVDSKAVNVLDASNFDSFLKENEKVLVEFYAPWCGHCKALAPDYSRVADSLFERGSPVKVAKFDASEEETRPIAEKFGIEGFPTLKFFEGGKFSEDYDAERNFDSILPWLLSREKPAVFDMGFEEFSALTADGDLTDAAVIDELTEHFGGDSALYLVVALNLEGSKRAKVFGKYAVAHRHAGMSFINVLLTKAQSKKLKKREGIMCRKGIHIVRLRIKDARDGGPLLTFTGKLKQLDAFLRVAVLGLFVDCDDSTLFRNPSADCAELHQIAETSDYDLLTLRLDSLHSDEAATARFKDSLLPLAAKLRNEGMNERRVLIGVTQGPATEGLEAEAALGSAVLITKELVADYKVFVAHSGAMSHRMNVVNKVSHMYQSTEELTAESVASFVDRAYAGEWDEYFTTQLNDVAFEKSYRKNDEYRVKQKALATGDFKEATTTFLSFFFEDTDTFVLNPDYDRIVLYKAEPCAICTLIAEKLSAVQNFVNTQFIARLRHKFMFGVFDLKESTREFTGGPVPFIVLYPKGTKRFEDGIRMVISQDSETMERIESMLTVDDFVDFLDEFSGVINPKRYAKEEL